MTTRVERDRHYDCSPGRCTAPMPSASRLRGRSVGPCVPRRTWWLRVNRAGRRQAFAFTTEGEARLAMEKLRAAAVLGQDYQPKVTTPTAPTFAPVAAEAIKIYQSTMSPEPSTLVNHASFLAVHLLPYFGTKPITSITTLEIQKFIAAKRTELADSTLKTSLPTLRLVLDHAVRLGLLSANPMRSGLRL